jgi:SAM-dependent methyltransferase
MMDRADASNGQVSVSAVTWCGPADAKAADCPVCKAPAAKPAILKTPSLVPGRGVITLLRCPECSNLFWDDLEPFAYEGGTGFPWSADFYVEQGAGVDALIEPIARLPAGGVSRYLEIGCGFGFSVDAAARLFGWHSIGVDPSPLAEAGRLALGLDIRPIYATTEVDLGGRFDVVYASEVIEHVGAPESFLSICRAHLAPDGILVLSTPDAGSIRPETPLPELILALSPGHHLILYSEEGLRHLLRAAGFAHVSVTSRGHRLVAYASQSPLDFDQTAPLDRLLYRRYLQQALEREPLRPSLRRGLRYRLLKEFVNAGDYDAGRPVLKALVADIEQSFEIGIEVPLSEATRAMVRSGPRTGHFGAPWCLPGILYCAGMIAQNGDGNAAAAAHRFELASDAAKLFREAYVSIGIDDGETGDFEIVAAREALLSLCRVDPARVLARLRARTVPLTKAFLESIVRLLIDLGETEAAAAAATGEPALMAMTQGFRTLHRPKDGKVDLRDEAAGGSVAGPLSPLPGTPVEAQALVTRLLDRRPRATTAELVPILVNLANLGFLEPAALIEPLLADAPGWHVTNARGLLALLHHRNPERAATLFARAWGEAIEAVPPAPPPESCRIKYHEAFAWLTAGDAHKAAAAAADLLGPNAPAWVTEQARSDLDHLLADHPLVRQLLSTETET